MEIGYCCDFARIHNLEDLGIFEIEINASYLSQLNEEEFTQIKNTLSKSKVKVSACNCLIQWELKNLFESENYNELTIYLNKLFLRLNIIGTKIVVFGSGNFRRIPENFEKEQAIKKTIDFLNFLTEIAEKYSLTIVIEPLNRKETNNILTTTEAMEYIKIINKRSLMLLVDLYHFDLENESISKIKEFKDYIKHIHIAKPKERTIPNKDDGYDYSSFINALKEIHYHGIISVETNFIGDFKTEVIRSKELFESYF